jgi:hypothetical protein
LRCSIEQAAKVAPLAAGNEATVPKKRRRRLFPIDQEPVGLAHALSAGAAGKNHAFCRRSTKAMSEKRPQAVFPID